MAFEKSKNDDPKSKNDDPFGLGSERISPDRMTFEKYLYQIPWWALILVAIGVWVGFAIAADDLYSNIFSQLKEGVQTTLQVAFFAYTMAVLVGLLVGIIRSNFPKPQKGITKRIISLAQLAIYNLATMFVEVMRGLPILTVLLIFAFVIIPDVKDFVAEQYGIVIAFRGVSIETAIIALSLTYGAYLSEIFRAGIQSVDRGQIEAARSLGMTYRQTMTYVVLPQAIRRVLPPLGNDFVAMIKDSSLVSVLGVRDVTQIARVSSGSSFRYLETYLTVAVIYLTMTVLGSIAVKLIERRLETAER